MPNHFHVDGWSLPVQSVTNIRKYLDGIHITRWQQRCLERQGFLIRVEGRLELAPHLRGAFVTTFQRP